MSLGLLREAYTRCQTEKKSLDVQDQKLVLVEPNETPERRARLAEYLKQIDWNNIPSQSPNDWEIVEHYFRPLKRYNDFIQSTDRKVENQMLKLYLKHSGVEVTEEECALLHQMPYEFSTLSRIVAILQKVKLPIEAPLLEAIQFMEIKEQEMEYAAPWIRGVTNWTDIALLYEKIKLLIGRTRSKTLQCLEPLAQGLTTKEKMLLLTRFFPPTEWDQFYHRLPPLNPHWTFQEKITVLKKAVGDEKAQLTKFTKIANVFIALKKTPYKIREAVFDLSKHLIAKIKNLNTNHQVPLITALNTIAPDRLSLFSGFVTINNRASIDTVKRDIYIFNAAQTYLNENQRVTCLNTFKNLPPDEKCRVDTELAAATDKRAYLEKLIGEPLTEETVETISEVQEPEIKNDIVQNIQFGDNVLDFFPLPDYGIDL